ncbi:MAG TPA: hypothetical protein VEF07_04855 [Candidatus Binataceae bacterium]|nr:hypothetical protein [Candidatus Binataceae bacterium]
MGTASGFDTEALARLRAQRLWSVFWVVGYVPLGFALFYGGAPPVYGTSIMLAWLAVGLWSLFRLRLLDCPRCGLLFYAASTWGSTNLSMPFAGHCMHCGFDLDSSDMEPIL